MTGSYSTGIYGHLGTPAVGQGVLYSENHHPNDAGGRVSATPKQLFMTRAADLGRESMGEGATTTNGMDSLAMTEGYM